MTSLVRALWAVLAAVALTLTALLALHFHDARVRDGAAAHATIAAKDDTITVLHRDIVSLGRAFRLVDSAWLVARATVTRVAYVPQSVRDSLAVLSRQVATALQRGDSTVTIATAVGLDGQLKACSARVLTIAAAVNGMVTDCERRVAIRDSVIAAQREIERLMTDQLAATRTMGKLTTPRFTPFVAINRSFGRKSWDAEVGTKMRLFAGFHVRALMRAGENLGRDSVGVRDSLPLTRTRHWDATLGGLYEFR